MSWQAAGSYEAEAGVVRDYVSERFDWPDKKVGYDTDGKRNVMAGNGGGAS